MGTGRVGFKIDSRVVNYRLLLNLSACPAREDEASRSGPAGPSLLGEPDGPVKRLDDRYRCTWCLPGVLPCRKRPLGAASPSALTPDGSKLAFLISSFEDEQMLL